MVAVLVVDAVVYGVVVVDQRDEVDVWRGAWGCRLRCMEVEKGSCSWCSSGWDEGGGDPGCLHF
eukprot:1300113-Amphidinium_carterae.4